MTTRFSGSALVAEWIYSGGTVTITGKQRTVAFNPTTNNIEASAGSDSHTVRISGISDHAEAITWLPDTDYISLEDALVEGTNGTLIIGPEGTASGKRKYTLPCISMGANINFPFSDVVEASVDFEGNGAPVRGTYT